MASRHRFRHCRGFTLVELLVALTLMAVAVGLLTNSLRFSSKTVEVVESWVAEVAAFHQSQHALRRLLQQALPVARPDSEKRDNFADAAKLDFEAAETRLDFIAPLPGLADGPGLYRVSIRIDTGGQRGRLLMSYQSYLGSTGSYPDEAASNELVLLQGFSDARFSFLDTRQALAADWVDNWQYEDRFPDLVRLSIQFDGVIESDAFELIMAPRVTSPARFGDS